MSIRQVKRLYLWLREQGASGLISKQRGVPSNWRIVDIAQHRDSRLELSYRGQAVRYKRYAYNEHLSLSKLTDAKTAGPRVNQAAATEYKQLASLVASIAPPRQPIPRGYPHR